MRAKGSWEPDALTRSLAYIARYAHQPVSEILSWPIRFRLKFHRALAEIVEKENATPEGGS